MSLRSLHFMNKRAVLLRPQTAVDVTTIRDRVIATHVQIRSSLPCMIEPAGGSIESDPNLGQVNKSLFKVRVLEGEDVRPNDILKYTNPKTGAISYYRLLHKEDFSEFGFPQAFDAILHLYFRGQ